MGLDCYVDDDDVDDENEDEEVDSESQIPVYCKRYLKHKLVMTYGQHISFAEIRRCNNIVCSRMCHTLSGINGTRADKR
jgi:hypothetical protein